MRYTPVRYTPVRCTPVRCTPVRCTPVRCTSTRYTPPWVDIWEVHVWEMYVCKVQLACECVRGIWEIFDVAGGAECRKAVAHGTAKAPTAAHREFAAIRIRTRSRSPETTWRFRSSTSR